MLLSPSVAMAQDDDWSGFYIAGEVGGASSKMQAASIDPIFQVTNINPPGAQPLTVVPGTSRELNQSETEGNFAYGGLVGFQFQTGQWVFGLEGGLEGPRDGSAVMQSNPLGATALTGASTVDQQRSAEFDYSWSVRARFGVSLGRTMLYTAGGLTGTRVEIDAMNTYTIPPGTSAGSSGSPHPTIGPNVATASTKQSMTGWTAGVGGEHKLGKHISFGLDLRYNDYGDKVFTFPTVAITRSGATTYPGAENGTGSLLPPINDLRADPGPTAISLSEWRAGVRLIFRF